MFSNLITPQSVFNFRNRFRMLTGRSATGGEKESSTDSAFNSTETSSQFSQALSQKTDSLSLSQSQTQFSQNLSQPLLQPAELQNTKDWAGTGGRDSRKKTKRENVGSSQDSLEIMNSSRILISEELSEQLDNRHVLAKERDVRSTVSQVAGMMQKLPHVLQCSLKQMIEQLDHNSQKKCTELEELIKTTMKTLNSQIASLVRLIQEYSQENEIKKQLQKIVTALEEEMSAKNAKIKELEKELKAIREHQDSALLLAFQDAKKTTKKTQDLSKLGSHMEQIVKNQTKKLHSQGQQISSTVLQLKAVSQDHQYIVQRSISQVQDWLSGIESSINSKQEDASQKLLVILQQVQHTVAEKLNNLPEEVARKYTEQLKGALLPLHELKNIASTLSSRLPVESATQLTKGQFHLQQARDTVLQDQITMHQTPSQVMGSQVTIQKPNMISHNIVSYQGWWNSSPVQDPLQEDDGRRISAAETDIFGCSSDVPQQSDNVIAHPQGRECFLNSNRKVPCHHYESQSLPTSLLEDRNGPSTAIAVKPQERTQEGKRQTKYYRKQKGKKRHTRQQTPAKRRSDYNMKVNLRDAIDLGNSIHCSTVYSRAPQERVCQSSYHPVRDAYYTRNSKKTGSNGPNHERIPAITVGSNFHSIENRRNPGINTACSQGMTEILGNIHDQKELLLDRECHPRRNSHIPKCNGHSFVINEQSSDFTLKSDVAVMRENARLERMSQAEVPSNVLFSEEIHRMVNSKETGLKKNKTAVMVRNSYDRTVDELQTSVVAFVKEPPQCLSEASSTSVGSSSAANLTTKRIVMELQASSSEDSATEYEQRNITGILTSRSENAETDIQRTAQPSKRRIMKVLGTKLPRNFIASQRGDLQTESDSMFSIWNGSPLRQGSPAVSRQDAEKSTCRSNLERRKLLQDTSFNELELPLSHGRQEKLEMWSSSLY